METMGGVLLVSVGSGRALNHTKEDRNWGIREQEFVSSNALKLLGLWPAPGPCESPTITFLPAFHAKHLLSLRAPSHPTKIGRHADDKHRFNALNKTLYVFF